jgi:Fe-S-cluster-containing dehydrogenase component
MKLGIFPLGKCDLCASRTDGGKEPACVATCPTGALRYEEVEEVFKEEKELVLGSHTVTYKTYIRRPK